MEFLEDRCRAVFLFAQICSRKSVRICPLMAHRAISLRRRFARRLGMTNVGPNRADQAQLEYTP
jgi:hypothetical protein